MCVERVKAKKVTFWMIFLQHTNICRWFYLTTVPPNTNVFCAVFDYAGKQILVMGFEIQEETTYFSVTNRLQKLESYFTQG